MMPSCGVLIFLLIRITSIMFSRLRQSARLWWLRHAFDVFTFKKKMQNSILYYPTHHPLALFGSAFFTATASFALIWYSSATKEKGSGVSSIPTTGKQMASGSVH
jgi:hypothetical protein